MNATNIGECHKKFHVPDWEMVRLDVFDRPATREAMMGIEEEIEYVVRGEVIAENVVVGDNVVCYVKVVMENNFGYCFVTNLSILWRKPSLILIKILTMKEIVSFVGATMTYYDSGTRHTISMMRQNLPTSIHIWYVLQSSPCHPLHTISVEVIQPLNCLLKLFN
jgi:hypothetical protein